MCIINCNVFIKKKCIKIYIAYYVILKYFQVSYFMLCSELKKLSEESLTRQPEEVFDIICKLGEGWVYVIFLCI